jgi:hypothetical protein
MLKAARREEISKKYFCRELFKLKIISESLELHLLNFDISKIIYRTHSTGPKRRFP